MTTTPATNSDRASLWIRIPLALKVAFPLAVLGFFFQFTLARTTTVGDVSGTITRCDYYYDLAAIAIAGILVVLAIAAVVTERAKNYDRLKLGMPIVLGADVILLVFAVIHVLRGFGVILSSCP